MHGYSAYLLRKITQKFKSSAQIIETQIPPTLQQYNKSHYGGAKLFVTAKQGNDLDIIG